jgi:hypothetical protein
MSDHSFGQQIERFRQRKPGLTKGRLAQLAGYDPAILSRMYKGGKDLSGPSGRDRVLRLIETFADEGVLTSRHEADRLLLAANLAPLYPGHSAEGALIRRLGGSGKTRLAQRAASDDLIQYADGVWYVELAAVSDPARVLEAVARGLCLPMSERSLLDQVTEYLQERQRTCPRLTVLATSRAPLGVPGEALWQTPPMQLDEADLLQQSAASLVTRPHSAPIWRDYENGWRCIAVTLDV